MGSRTPTPMDRFALSLRSSVVQSHQGSGGGCRKLLQQRRLPTLSRPVYYDDAESGHCCLNQVGRSAPHNRR